ncbi:hypothetical protein CsSME_00023259 [Camellia sinensis var. sinensis]
MCNFEFVQNMQRRNNRGSFMFIEMRLVWLWWVMLVLASECYGCLEHERIALLQLNALTNYPNGSTLQSWLDAWKGEETTDCCQWGRVKCKTTTRRVIQLSLNYSRTHYDSGAWYLNDPTPFEELHLIQRRQ